MNLTTKMSVIAITALSLNACVNVAPTPQRQQTVSYPTVITPAKPAIQELRMTIGQGTTTKQSIFQGLGQPDNYASDANVGVKIMQYFSHKKENRVIYLTYIEKDGTRFSFVIGNNDGQERTLFVHLDRQDKVSGIQVF